MKKTSDQEGVPPVRGTVRDSMTGAQPDGAQLAGAQPDGALADGAQPDGATVRRRGARPGRKMPGVAGATDTELALLLAEWENRLMQFARAGAAAAGHRASMMTANRRGRRSWVPAFLNVLECTGNVRHACRAVGISRQNAYSVRKRNAAFAEAWDLALEMASDRLQEEAWRRAVEGVERPVMYRGRPVLGPDGEPLMERHFSDILLDRLLRLMRPEKYRDRGSNPARDSQSVVKVYSGVAPDTA